MSHTEHLVALELLEKNLNRYERLTYPTDAECAMYKNLWEIYCLIQERIALHDLQKMFHVEQSLKQELILEGKESQNN
jgi:hypothetical protein